MTLIDTAEMYADGDTEVLVGEAIAGRRDEVFLVSKVLPAQRDPAGDDRGLPGQPEAAPHRPARPLPAALARAGAAGETIEAFLGLKADGMIRHWGVSNFDVLDLAELVALGGDDVQTDQVLYNLEQRAPEIELLRLCRERRRPDHGVLADRRGRILSDPVLADVAARHNASPAQTRWPGCCAWGTSV